MFSPDKRDESERRRITSPSYALGVGVPTPVGTEQAPSDNPNEYSAVLHPAERKFNAASSARDIRTNKILAAHRLNLPFTDQFLRVADLYHRIRKVAFNWQQDKPVSFFGNHPKLRILAPGETMTTYSDDELRVMVDELSLRLAMYYSYYEQATLLWLGALANMHIWTKEKGDDTTQQIALAMRFSWTSGQFGSTFNRFPLPTGAYDYIVANSKSSIGTNAYGATIQSHPIWRTTFFGNVGKHAPTMEDFIAGVVSDDESVTTVNVLSANNIPEEEKADIQRFYDHALKTTKEYASWFKEPRIVNGGLATVGSNIANPSPAVGFGAWSLNADDWQDLDNNSNLPSFVKNAFTGAGTDQIVASFWISAISARNYLVKNFPQMSDVNSELYRFAVMTGTEGLGICESLGRDYGKFQKDIWALDNVPMTELSNLMKYRAHGKVNTATLIRVNLLDGGSDGTAWTEESSWEYNMHRYDELLTGNVTQAIEQSKAWAHNAPAYYASPFASNSQLARVIPMFVNMGPSSGMFGTSGAAERPTLDEIGIGASLFDIVSLGSHDPTNTSATFAGITADTAKSWLSGKEVLAAEENPTVPLVWTTPLIDNSDPAQCGFEVLVSRDNPYPNIWEQYFKDSTIFKNGDVGTAELASDNECLVQVNRPSLCTAEWAAAHLCKVEHLVNPDMLGMSPHQFVFVGAGIFDDPVASLARKQAGNPVATVASALWSAAVTPAKFTTPEDLTDIVAAITDIVCAEGKFNSWNLKPSDQQKLRAKQAFHLLFEPGDDGNFQFNTFVFDPSYGPVSVFQERLDLTEDTVVDRNIMNSSDYNVARGADASEVKGIDTHYTVMGADTIQNTTSLLAQKISSIGDTFWTAGHTYSFGLAELKPVLSKVENGILLPIEASGHSIVFNPTMEWLSYMMGTVTVYSLGHSKRLPFWSPEMGEKFGSYDNHAIPAGTIAPLVDVSSIEPRKPMTRNAGKVVSEMVHTQRPPVREGWHITNDRKADSSKPGTGSSPRHGKSAKRHGRKDKSSMNRSSNTNSEIGDSQFVDRSIDNPSSSAIKAEMKDVNAAVKNEKFGTATAPIQ